MGCDEEFGYDVMECIHSHIQNYAEVCQIVDCRLHYPKYEDWGYNACVDPSPFTL